MPKSANLLPFTGPVLAEFYHGTWDIIPVFEVLTPVRTAWVASAEEASLQEDYVALRITGAVELSRAGMCAIALGSSDQYDRTFSHDVPNIVEQLLFEGDFANARAVMESDYYQRLGRELEQDYLDAIPKYLMPYATYLMHTGDTAYFTESRRADLRRIARRIHEYRLPQMTPEARDRGLYGLMNPSNTMDNGQDFLLVDNLAALHGLVAYCYLAGRLGEAGEVSWAKAELDDLNICLNEALRAGMCRREKPWFHVMMEVEEHALHGLRVVGPVLQPPGATAQLHRRTCRRASTDCTRDSRRLAAAGLPHRLDPRTSDRRTPDRILPVRRGRMAHARTGRGSAGRSHRTAAPAADR